VRVISLLPAATEMVAALGATELLVGISHECDHPTIVGSRARVTSSAVDSSAAPATIDAQVRALHDTGASLYALDEALIRALRPDVIITQALCDVCAVSETDVRALASRLDPVPQIVTISATTLDGVFDDVVRVAAALDRADEATELIAGFRARMRTVHETLKAAKAPRPRVAFLEWTAPVFPGGHWVPEMITRAGGIDVLAQPGMHASAIEIGHVAAASADVVIVAPCGYDIARASTEASALLTASSWEFLNRTAVWSLDANAFSSRPGPRLVDGIEILARIFNPGCFTPLDDSHAQRISS
jgi:iron complex transport system substrate-binding protein